jgi:YD repeat-containing protein
MSIIMAGRPSRRFFSRAMALWCALYMTLSPAAPLFAQEVSEEVQAISNEAEAVETESEPISWDAESISMQSMALPTSMGGGEEAPASLQGNSSSQGQAGLAVNASANPFTGSFTSGLSIRVPAGRQGMQPNLSVGYDSSSGNGLLGVGWGLTKNLIFRSGRNKGTPQFNETDEFYLSLAGSTLKLTPVEHCECASPCTMREFRTRTESFSKVIAHYDAAYGSRIEWWEVFGKTGMKYRFGSTANSQLPNVQWYLDYTEDTSGNFMEFIYDGRLLSGDTTEDLCAGLRAFDVSGSNGVTSLNHVLLSEVKYTGNSVKGDDPHNRVKFIYEPRPDVITSYRTTYRQELKDYLKRIEVYSNDTFLLWEYVFEYTPSASSPSQRSLLTSIQQVGRNGAALPPVVFEYQEGDVRWDKTGPFIATIPGQAFLKNSDPGQRYGQGARLVDFNGDGRVDKVDSYIYTKGDCETVNYGVCELPSPCKECIESCGQDPYDCAVPCQSECSGVECQTTDPDACERAAPEEYANAVYLNTGAGWSTDALEGVSVPGLPFDERWKNKDGTVQAGPGGAQLADVNGDGLADKLDFKVFEDPDCSFATCNTLKRSGVAYYCNQFCLPEFVPTTVNSVYLHAGFGWSEAPHPTLQLPGLPLAERVGINKVAWRDRGARLVDVNGDGRADKVDFHRDSDEAETRGVYLNLGDSDGDGEHDGWLPAPVWSDSLPGEPFTQLSPSGLNGWPAHTVDLGTRLMDMNADGLPDKVDFHRIHYVSDYGCPAVCQTPCDPLLRDDAVFSVFFNTGRGWEQTPDPALSFVMPWNSYNGADRPFGLPFAYVKRRVKCICFSAECYLSPFTTNTAPEGTAAIDFNGDGLPDKVDWDNNGANEHTALLVNDGNGWQEIAIVQDAEFSNNIDFVVLMKGRGLVFDDANADGLLDGIQSFLDQTAATKKIRHRVGPYPDLLSTVHNGTGGTTRVSYAPAASFAHDPISQDWNGAPERNWVTDHDNPIETVEWNLPFNMQVVASVTASDGQVTDESDPDFPRHNYTTRYEYAGGLFDPGLGEFQGFRRVRAIEDATDNFSDTYFKQEGRVTGVDLLLPPEEQEAKKGPFSGLTEHALAYEAITPLGVNEDATPANSILLAETFNQYGAVQNVPDPEDPAEWADIFQIELARSDTWTFESQGGFSVFKLRTAVSYGYDDFGNVTEVLRHGAVHSWTDHVNEFRIHLNDTEQWRLGYVLSERVALSQVWPEALCEPQLVCSPDPAIGCRIRCPWELQTGRQFNTYREKQFFYDDLPFQEMGTRGLRTKEEQVLSDFYLPRPSPASFVTTAQYSYDDYGNLVSITDAKGNTTTMAYDPVLHQFLVQTVNALGHANTVEYNEAGQVLTSTDANIVTSFTDYDDLWRPIRSKVRPAGSADIFVLEEYFYNDCLLGDPWEQHTETRTNAVFTTAETPRLPCPIPQTLDANVLWSRSFFDGMGRSYKTRRKGDAGKTIVQVSRFNERGLVGKVSKPFFAGEPRFFVETEYDSKGRAVLVTAPDGSVTQTIYDGLETTVIDANGKKARTEVDAYGRTVAVTEFFEGQELTTSYSYLPTGELDAVVDALGTRVAFMRYDTWGRKRRINDVDSERTTYEYDLNSNLILQYRGQWPAIPLWFEYDELDRLTRKEYENGDEVLYEYDDPTVPNGAGRLTRRTERNGDISTFGYDSFGRIVNTTKETVIDGQIAVLSVETEWDALGRQSRLTYPDGFFVEYFYNDAGHLESVVGSDATVYATYPDYNASGQFTHVGLGNGITTDYAYDPLNDRLTNLFTQTF